MKNILSSINLRKKDTQKNGKITSIRFYVTHEWKHCASLDYVINKTKRNI
jgi:hypothetical protein